MFNGLLMNYFYYLIRYFIYRVSWITELLDRGLTMSSSEIGTSNIFSKSKMASQKPQVGNASPAKDDVEDLESLLDEEPEELGTVDKSKDTSVKAPNTKVKARINSIGMESLFVEDEEGLESQLMELIGEEAFETVIDQAAKAKVSLEDLKKIIEQSKNSSNLIENLFKILGKENLNSAEEMLVEQLAKVIDKTENNDLSDDLDLDNLEGATDEVLEEEEKKNSKNLYSVKDKKEKEQISSKPSDKSRGNWQEQLLDLLSQAKNEAKESNNTQLREKLNNFYSEIKSARDEKQIFNVYTKLAEYRPKTSKANAIKSRLVEIFLPKIPLAYKKKLNMTFKKTMKQGVFKAENKADKESRSQEAKNFHSNTEASEKLSNEEDKINSLSNDYFLARFRDKDEKEQNRIEALIHQKYKDLKKAISKIPDKKALNISLILITIFSSVQSMCPSLA